jgi:hypothetical protein
MEGNLGFWEGNSAKKMDKDEKFYFAKVEALFLTVLVLSVLKFEKHEYLKYNTIDFAFHFTNWKPKSICYIKSIQLIY